MKIIADSVGRIIIWLIWNINTFIKNINCKKCNQAFCILSDSNFQLAFALLLLSPVKATVFSPFRLNKVESSIASFFLEQKIKPLVIPLSLP
jgi:hypothetical protein